MKFTLEVFEINSRSKEPGCSACFLISTVDKRKGEGGQLWTTLKAKWKGITRLYQLDEKVTDRDSGFFIAQDASDL
jgi:hypothetical protein